MDIYSHFTCSKALYRYNTGPMGHSQASWSAVGDLTEHERLYSNYTSCLVFGNWKLPIKLNESHPSCFFVTTQNSSKLYLNYCFPSWYTK